MKENLKKAAKYFREVLFVALFAPVVLVKAVVDPLLYVMIALVHALFNEKEASANALKNVLKNID